MALYIGGVAVDATAAEIDVLDGLDRGSIIYGNASSATTVLGQGGADEVLTSDGTDIAWAAAGGASDIGALDDVTMDIANFVDGILIQPDSDGSAPGTGTLNSTTGNVGIGRGSFSALTSGSYNVAMGYQALELNTTGNNNAAFGRYALGVNTTGENNVAIGCNALCVNTEGDQNTCVGNSAGTAIASGSKNVCIGDAVDSEAGSNWRNVVIGSDITYGGDGLRIGSSGNYLSADFSGAQTFTVSSDVRKKRNISDNTNLGLDFINQLRTVTYQYKPAEEHPEEWKHFYYEKDEAGNNLDEKIYADMDTDTVHYGMVAQEVKEVLDDRNVTFSGWNEDFAGQQGVVPSSFVYPLIKAIQELSAKVEALENA